MYRIKEIEQRLLHVVGWAPSFNPAEALDDDLTQTESGLYFQEAHPLCTLDNVRSIMPDDVAMQYPVWAAATEYAAGAIVRHGRGVWRAAAASTDVAPGSDSAVWMPYDVLSSYLRRLTRAGIVTAVQTFVQMKQLTHETHTLLERLPFFDGAGRLINTIENRGKICGYEIVGARSMGVTIKVERIGLQMTGGVGTVRLYLFHSSQADPVRVIDVEYTKTNGGYQWFDIQDLYLPYISDATGAGGSWYLCYDQNALPRGMEAVNISKDWSREPCMSCNMGNVQQWRELTRYMQISPFVVSAAADFGDYPEMWDIARNVYTNTMCYGLNVEVTVGCDLTDFIISQRDLFKTVIQREVAATVLRTIAMNPDVRVNRNQSNVSRVDILYELDGDSRSSRRMGFMYELRKAYEALRLDTAGIDRICLPCRNNGVRYTST